MMKKTVELRFRAPEAKKVSLAGSFNNWKPNGILARKDRTGNWAVKLSLAPGKYEYKFVVDGSWLTDPSCRMTVPNGMGSNNCVLEIK